MEYWTETNDHTHSTDVKTKVNNVIINIGLIERPYNSTDIFIASVDNQFLFNCDTYAFGTMDAAKHAIIKHFEKELEMIINEGARTD